MTQPGTPERPLRVAIIGSGPAGFYAADHLFRRKDLIIEVDMFDRLATPFGLVRFGVAPDHQKIKTAIKPFEKTASNPNFTFYGSVDFGSHLSLEDLKNHYHQICFATGAQTDRQMGIEGEDLAGSHTATEFVAWYNGHPEYRDHVFDLSAERIAVVGVGNVAVDVARILCRTPDELAKTDITDYALEALAECNVKEVYMLGRRGPAQAAFTNPEAKELGELEGADIYVPPAEAQLDPLSQAYVDESDDRKLLKKIEIIQGFANKPATGKARRLTLRFLVSPTELCGDSAGRVVTMKLVKNELLDDGGRLRPKPTGEVEELPVELVFRSVGYRGVPLPGIPFNDELGVVPNEKGRVTSDGTQATTGLYVTGWIKRGPTGIIGTNKPDAGETVACMVEDLEHGSFNKPADPTPESIRSLIEKRQPQYVSFDDWRRLDQMEIAAGAAGGRPRVKFTSVEEIQSALNKS